MAKLIYGTIESLDGYIADVNGNFDWSVPDEEVHKFINDFERPIGTYLYGRRLYEVMMSWENPLSNYPPYIQDFARIWQAADKIVFSKTLEKASSAKTQIEREFNPETIKQMKATAKHDIAIGGADLAGQAMKAGLVDEINLFVTPIVIGGGIQSLPNNLRLNLELLDEHRFRNGFIHLRYCMKT